MANILYSTVRPLDFLLSEANFHRTRDNVVLAQNAAPYQPGQVLGKITASGKFAPFNPAASDGTAIGVAVCCYPYDATASDIRGVVVDRDCEVKVDGLIWPTGISDANKSAGVANLQAAGIIVR